MIRKILATILVLVGSWIAWNWTVLSDFHKLAAGYYAKEFCTCRFVLGRDREACMGLVKQYIPLGGIETEGPVVTAKALGITQKARHLGPNEGCRLEPWN